MIFNWMQVPSPIGNLTLVAQDDRLAAILWEVERPGRVRLGEMRHAPDDVTLNDVNRQLQQYFAGERNTFELKLAFTGTEFQKSVWSALLSIPFGETRTYSQIAGQIGNPAAVRAVGAANGRNPIAIIAPCHRVIGADGSLTGFAGGLEAKEYLLKLEGITVSARGVMRQQSLF